MSDLQSWAHERLPVGSAEYERRAAALARCRCYWFSFSSIHPMPMPRYPFVDVAKMIGYSGTIPPYSIVLGHGALTTIG
jgi:hypothetical protein